MSISKMQKQLKKCTEAKELKNAFTAENAELTSKIKFKALLRMYT